MIKRSTLPELLCPAGDEPALRAAVDCGANAVYLGMSAFGARASATNFTPETLERGVRYAHLYHARVHVTVNTLVRQDELSAVSKVLEAIAQAGADAVIVQDLGVAALVKERFPSLKLHASTQMALCNAEGAKVARKLGFSRVVLARECTLDQMRMVAQTGMETEVFVHGALCAAVSGRCLMSAMAGGRSGNRGRCAQPCRQNFALEGLSGALLSLRDLCLIDDLPALCDAGVASLKVEGRMKSAEYVAVVATAYRRALDQIARGSFHPGEARDALLQIFNRGGFTRGHAMGMEDAALCSPGRVSHEGVALGVITGLRGGLADMRADRALNDGDSLQIRGQQDEELRYSGHAVAAGKTAAVRLRPGMQISVGSPVFRLSDARQLEEARAHAPRPIPISMHARFSPDQPMALILSDGVTSVTAFGAIPEQARSRASTPEEACRSLQKLGGTPFALAQACDLTVACDGELFLPVGALNALRREAVSLLEDTRIRAFRESGGVDKFDAQAAQENGGVAANETFADASEASADANATFAHTGAAATSLPGMSAPEAPSFGAHGAESLPLRANAAIAPPLFAHGVAAPSFCADAANPPPSAVSVLAVVFSDPALAQPLLEAGATMPVYAPRTFTRDALAQALPRLPRGTWLRLPPQLTDQTLAVALNVISQNGAQLGGLMAQSVGQLDLPVSLPLWAGEGVPVCNREGMAALATTRAVGFTLWPEWTGAQQRALAPLSLPCLIKVYGRETLMLLNHCPERVRRGLSAGRAACALCHGEAMACGREGAALRDRKGYRFPLWRTVFPEGCELSVLNALPTDLRAYDAERRALRAGMLLCFTTESAEEQLSLTRDFAALLRGEATPPAIPAFAGLWTRGVE